jgi:hypothetical protein
LVKVPRYNNKYIVVYQKKKSKAYYPHFFLYDIMSRSVTRRFMADSVDFDLFWDNDRRGAQTYHESKTKNKINEMFSDDDDVDSLNVNCFEVSPQGTFLVCIINEEILSLKYLPNGFVTDLIDSIEPFYYAEHEEAKKNTDEYGRSKSQYFRESSFRGAGIVKEGSGSPFHETGEFSSE